MMIHVRVLKPSDAAWMPYFYYFTLFVPGGTLSPPWEIMGQAPFQHYVENWGRAGDIGFVLTRDGAEEPIGMGWFRQFDGHHAGFGFIDDETPEVVMALHPAYRGCGLGSDLLLRLVQQARYEGFTGLSLSVHRDNPAIRFYRRHSFALVYAKEPLQVMQLTF